MKTIIPMLAGAVAILSAIAVSAQNTLQFTSANATPEKAIQLHWASNPSEVYEIDYATSLIDTNTGTITWNKLYDDYPSHGTNTFWLDTGDYNVSPAVNHPKNDSMRFYRVVLQTIDNEPTEPTISITAPTDGSTVSSNITVTVSAYSPDTLADVKLYVDGQEMPIPDNRTNFVINTCEWWNGPHVLFATAKSVSHFEGIANDSSVTYGHAVSAYVNLNFSNLITEVAFSQPYFEPSLGQTQQVTAYLTLNSDWTLKIQDVYGNTVRTTTGSGNYLTFNWDGMGDSETNIPDGIYTYFITAHTNGQPNQLIASGGSGGGGVLNPPSFSMMANASETQLYVADDSGNVLPLAIYPPNFDTNGFTIFEATPSDIQSLRATPSSATLNTTSFTPAASPADSPSGGISGQSTDTPMRPPTTKGKGTVGTFFVGYNAYITSSGTWTAGPIPTGWPYGIPPQYVAVDGETQSQASHSETFGSIYENTAIAGGFAWNMQNGRWKGSVNRNIGPSDVTGGIFNNANVGLLLCHASYGTTAEADGVKRSYLRFFNQNTFQSSYCRLDDCSFGGSGTNGLKYMAILACDVLQNTDYNTLYNYGRLPINNDLHLLLSESTVATSPPIFGAKWANRLIGDGTNNPPETVAESWFDAGQAAYDNSNGYGETNHITITFRVAGWPDAFSEHVTDNLTGSVGTGNVLDITKSDRTVFSNP